MGCHVWLYSFLGHSSDHIVEYLLKKQNNCISNFRVPYQRCCGEYCYMLGWHVLENLTGRVGRRPGLPSSISSQTHQIQHSIHHSRKYDDFVLLFSFSLCKCFPLLASALLCEHHICFFPNISCIACWHESIRWESDIKWGVVWEFAPHQRWCSYLIGLCTNEENNVMDNAICRLLHFKGSLQLLPNFLRSCKDIYYHSLDMPAL